MSNRLETCIIQDYKQGRSIELLSVVYAETKETILKVIIRYIAARNKLREV